MGKLLQSTVKNKPCRYFPMPYDVCVLLEYLIILLEILIVLLENFVVGFLCK